MIKSFCAIVFALAFILFLPSVYARTYKDDAAQGLGEGTGIWANIWNYPSGDLNSYCANLQASGVTNLFIQTSRSNTCAVKEPEKLGALIDACHKYKIRVIAWSFAELINPEKDAQKMILAALFTSPTGQHIDAIAPNLEKNLESSRIESYSKILRNKLGPNYPMIVVVYSPLNLCNEVQKLSWPLLPKYYDVIAPMIYWNSKYQVLDPYAYTSQTLKKIRLLTGKPDLELHAIGDGMGTKASAIKAFLQACSDNEATSVSLYPNQRVTKEQLETLASSSTYLPTNAKLQLAAFREYINSGDLNPPANNDPSISITHQDFYQLLIRQMYPVLANSKNLAKLNSINIAEYKDADSNKSYELLVKLGLVAPPSEDSAQNFLSSSVNSNEALSLLEHILEFNHDKTKNSLSHAKHHGLDRLFVSPAIAETSLQCSVGEARSFPETERLYTAWRSQGTKATEGLQKAEFSGNKPLNYIDASSLILKASSISPSK